MQYLKEDLKKNQYQNVYLFFGEEHYLVQHYEARLRVKIGDMAPSGMQDMNLIVFLGKETKSEKIIDACDTLPFFSEKRLVIVRDSGLFATGKKDETEKIGAYIEEIPETTVLLFVETDVDKRNSLYKKVVKKGRTVEFKSPEERELIDWIIKYCRKNGKIISQSSAVYLLRTVATNMDNISTELQKLIAYKGEEQEIFSVDIAAICNKSLESKIFDLVGAIGNKNVEKALDEYANLLQMKESPLMVLSMIARQFRIILQCKYLSLKGLPQQQISDRLQMKGFIVREGLTQGRFFEIETLKKAFYDCLETDVKIKSGQMQDELAVELLILEYCR